VSGARERPLRARWRSLALDPDGVLGTFARLAACVYAEHSTDDAGELRYPPSSATLADWMGCAERTARKARQELVDAGLLELEQRPGRTARVRLTFVTPARGAGVTPARTPAATPARTPARRAAGTRGTRGTRGPTSGGAHSRARADGPVRADGRAEHDDGAQRLVAGYVARLHELGASTPRRLVGQVAREVGELVRDGVPAPTIAAALELLLDRRLGPTTLASLVPEAELGPGRRAAGNARAATRKDLDGYDRA
jgi:hypothetical protein